MPEPERPELPLMPPDSPELAPEALRADPLCPSPCDEPRRSRPELLDDEPLIPPLLPDEPASFWLRSAMIPSSRVL